MNLVRRPNLPEDKVRVAAIDGRAGEVFEAQLLKLGIEPVKTGKFQRVYDSVAFHPDIVMHHLGDDKIVYAPGTDTGFLSKLRDYGFRLIKGGTVLTDKYPGDIAYNVARIGNYAVHDFRHTDPVLKKALEIEGVEFINVKQGYSKCSICILNESCIITSDKGIAKAVEKKGVEALLIGADENILLPGLDKGFIGGSTGLIGSNVLAVTGDIKRLKSFEMIAEYLAIKGVEIVCLGDGHIMDIGSIIPLLTV